MIRRRLLGFLAALALVVVILLIVAAAFGAVDHASLPAATQSPTYEPSTGEHD